MTIKKTMTAEARNRMAELAQDLELDVEAVCWNSGEDTPEDIAKRIEIERHVTNRLLTTAHNNSWPCIGLDSGAGFVQQTDRRLILEECFAVDEIYLFFRSAKEIKKEVWVHLVYGNSGWDLICNNSVVPEFEATVMEIMTAYCEGIADALDL